MGSAVGRVGVIVGPTVGIVGELLGVTVGAEGIEVGALVGKLGAIVDGDIVGLALQLLLHPAPPGKH